MPHIFHVELQIIVLRVERIDHFSQLSDLLAQLVEHVVGDHVVGALLSLPGDVTIDLETRSLS